MSSITTYRSLGERSVISKFVCSFPEHSRGIGLLITAFLCIFYDRKQRIERMLHTWTSGFSFPDTGHLFFTLLCLMRLIERGEIPVLPSERLDSIQKSPRVSLSKFSPVLWSQSNLDRLRLRITTFL